MIVLLNYFLKTLIFREKKSQKNYPGDNLGVCMCTFRSRCDYKAEYGKMNIELGKVS